MSSAIATRYSIVLYTGPAFLLIEYGATLSPFDIQSWQSSFHRILSGDSVAPYSIMELFLRRMTRITIARLLLLNPICDLYRDEKRYRHSTLIVEPFLPSMAHITIAWLFL